MLDLGEKDRVISLAFLRESFRSGKVVRYHTLPTVSQENVGDHSHRVAVLAYYLFPGDPALILGALFHDAPEMKFGDLPFTGKFREVKQALESREQSWLKDHDMSIELTPKQRAQLKICDLLQMIEFAYHEYLLGSRMSFEILRNAEAAMRDYLAAFCDAEYITADQHVNIWRIVTEIKREMKQ